MKITHNKVGQNLNLNDSGKSEKTESSQKSQTPSAVNNSLFSPRSSEASKVDLSDRAMEAKKIKELALAAPDVDQAKVEKFRKLIDEGKYSVNSKDVADKMVDEELSLFN